MGTSRRTRRALALGGLLVGLLGPATPSTAGSAREVIDARPAGMPKDQPARGLHYDGLRPARAGGPCGNDFEVVADGHLWCTHGPDPAPAGVDVRTAPARLVGEAASRTPGVAPECVGTGSDGPRVQVIYAYPTTMASRYNTVKPSIQTWVAGVDDIFLDSAAETGGAQRVRWVTDDSCEVVVIEQPVPAGAAGEDFGLTLDYLAGIGYDHPDRKYLVFMDAAELCGVALQMLDDSPGQDNANNGGTAFFPTPGMIARVDRACWNAGVAAHELLHNLGAVQDSAPHATGYGHCTDEWDRLCYDDGPGTVLDLVCPDSEHDALLDCNHDDYYSTSPGDGTYLDTHWNTARSKWLYEPGGGGPGDNGPPGASIVTPGDLTSPVQANFDETVRPVDADNFTVSVLGSDPLDATLGCQGLTTLTVDCETGNVRDAELGGPTWLPGQRYEVQLNPDGTTPIADPLGNLLPPTTRTFRASTKEQENSVAATHVWDRVDSNKASGGSYTRERLGGARATFRFTNVSTTNVSWFATRGPGFGRANVVLDGYTLDTVDLYWPNTTYKSEIQIIGITPGEHTLAIVVTGTARAAADGTFVSVDAIKVGTTLSTNPAMTYGWQRKSSGSASGGAYARSQLGGSAMSFTFRGTGISWYTLVGPGMGKAVVYIDGVKRGTPDNWSSTSKWVRRAYGGLTDAMHTLKIIVLGAKRPASHGTAVVVDRFVVT